MAYKRELIVNNGSLTSYKKLLKVSDVCQLLDKSKYPATQTINGVTFTNNGDGTITYNGVTSVGANYSLQSGLRVVSGHKYFSCIGENIGDKISVLLYANEDPYNTFDNRFPNADGEIVTALKNSDELYYQPKPHYNISFSNFVIKPQLFDLTEMYGAGNEPATVAEFKAKFPNDLYDYSPRCWVKSYKTGLIAKTKNLFNLATASVGYINSRGYLDNSEDTITYGLGSDYLECTPNTSYTISAFCGKHPVTLGATLWCRIAWYDENKQLLDAPSKFFTDTNIDYISATWTAPTNAKYLRATTRWMSPTYREQHPENWVMLEKGSTATDYVPYGYL